MDIIVLVNNEEEIEEVQDFFESNGFEKGVKILTIRDFATQTAIFLDKKVVMFDRNEEKQNAR